MKISKIIKELFSPRKPDDPSKSGEKRDPAAPHATPVNSTNSGGSKARWHHYYFAHKLLPKLFFENDERFVEQLEKSGQSFIQNLWQVTGKQTKHLTEDQLKRAASGDFSLEVISSEELVWNKQVLSPAVTLYIIQLPKPVKPPEAALIAIIYYRAHLHSPRYLVLEPSQGFNLVGEWGSKGERWMVDFLDLVHETQLQKSLVEFVVKHLTSLKKL